MQFAITAALFGLAATVFATVELEPRLEADPYCHPNGDFGIVQPSNGAVITIGKPTLFHYCSRAYFKESSLGLKLKIVRVHHKAGKPHKVVYQTNKFNTSTSFTTGYATLLVIPKTKPGKYHLITNEDATGYNAPSDHYTYTINVTIAKPSH